MTAAERAAIGARFGDVGRYLGTVTGTAVVVTWAADADRDPAGCVGVEAVTVDGRASAYADAAWCDWGTWADALADGLTAELARAAEVIG